MGRFYFSEGRIYSIYFVLVKSFFLRVVLFFVFYENIDLTPQRIDFTPFSKLDVTSTNNCCLSGSLPYGWTRHYSYFHCLPSSLDGSSPPGAPRLDEALQYYCYFDCLPSSLPSSSRGRLRRGWSVRCLTSPPPRSSKSHGNARSRLDLL